MTIAPVAESVEGAGSEVSGRGTKASIGSAVGLVPTPKMHHPYVAGGVLLLVGLFGLIGSITGSLPSMIAALFDPDALEDVTTQSSVSSDVLGTVENVLKETNPLNTPQVVLNKLFGLKLPELP